LPAGRHGIDPALVHKFVVDAALLPFSSPALPFENGRII